MRYYHVSSARNLKPGDIIDPRSIGLDRPVWLSTSPTPHFTLYRNGKESVHLKRLNVYQVYPHGKVKKGAWDDLVCYGYVEVLRNLGQASKNGRGSAVGKGRKPYFTRCYDPSRSADVLEQITTTTKQEK